MTKGHTPRQDGTERHAPQMEDTAARRESGWQAGIRLAGGNPVSHDATVDIVSERTDKTPPTTQVKIGQQDPPLS